MHVINSTDAYLSIPSCPQIADVDQETLIPNTGHNDSISQPSSNCIQRWDKISPVIFQSDMAR